MSYVSSAGIARGAPDYGMTCRQDVLGGVDVPVMPGAAGRAGPVPCPRLSSASRCPHASQVLDDGYFTVEALTRRQPYPDAEVATERAYLLARAR